MTVSSSIYMAPKPGRAQRPFLRKTPNHFVGELTFGEETGQGQTLGFGSKLEHDVALLAIYWPGVVDVREQVRVDFTKPNGKPGKHFIDYVTTEACGRRTAILVKTQSMGVRAHFRETASRVAEAAIPAVVDRAVIATEAMLDRDLMMRVEQFHSCRFAQPDIDKIVAEAVCDFNGPASIRDFLALAGLDQTGFHAVVRMIRFERLEALEQGLLKLSTLIRRKRIN